MSKPSPESNSNFSLSVIHVKIYATWQNLEPNIQWTWLNKREVHWHADIYNTNFNTIQLKMKHNLKQHLCQTHTHKKKKRRCKQRNSNFNAHVTWSCPFDVENIWRRPKLQNVWRKSSKLWGKSSTDLRTSPLTIKYECSQMPFRPFL